MLTLTARKLARQGLLFVEFIYPLTILFRSIKRADSTIFDAFGVGELEREAVNESWSCLVERLAASRAAEVLRSVISTPAMV